MSINLALLILLVLATFYLMVVEIFTIVFMMTGLSHTRSVFQVISLLTNSGFTTNESEIIVTSRKRRKIAIVTMLVGNMLNVLIISVIVNALIAISNQQAFNVLQTTLFFVIILVLIISYKRLPFMRERFDRFIKKVANRIMFSKHSNPLLILDNFHNFCIAEVKIITVPEIFIDRTIFETRISNDHGIRVLYIKRGEEYIGYIEDTETVKLYDRIIVFGPKQEIVDIFGNRPE